MFNPLLGVYGDVVRVKILYNKRDSALIQFKEPQHAQTGTSVCCTHSLSLLKVWIVIRWSWWCG